MRCGLCSFRMMYYNILSLRNFAHFQGDSGAPLVCKSRHKIFQGSGSSKRLDRIATYWHLVGLVSWGYQCARHRKPGVYTEFGRYQNWIMRELKERPKLETEFWNSLIQCNGDQITLDECDSDEGRKTLWENGVHC